MNEISASEPPERRRSGPRTFGGTPSPLRCVAIVFRWLRPSPPPWRFFRSLINGAEVWLPPGDGQNYCLRIKTKKTSLRIPGRPPCERPQAPSTTTTKEHRLDYKSYSTKTDASFQRLSVCSGERNSGNLHLQESLSNLWDYPDMIAHFPCLTCLWMIKRSEQVIMGGRVHAAEVSTL